MDRRSRLLYMAMTKKQKRDYWFALLVMQTELLALHTVPPGGIEPHTV